MLPPEGAHLPEQIAWLPGPRAPSSPSSFRVSPVVCEEKGHETREGSGSWLDFQSGCVGRHDMVQFCRCGARPAAKVQEKQHATGFGSSPGGGVREWSSSESCGEAPQPSGSQSTPVKWACHVCWPWCPTQHIRPFLERVFLAGGQLQSAPDVVTSFHFMSEPKICAILYRSHFTFVIRGSCGQGPLRHFAHSRLSIHCSWWLVLPAVLATPWGAEETLPHSPHTHP